MVFYFNTSLTIPLAQEWKSIPLLVLGKGTLGIGRFKNLHKGSQSSITSKTSKWFSGMVCFTFTIWDRDMYFDIT